MIHLNFKRIIYLKRIIHLNKYLNQQGKKLKHYYHEHVIRHWCWCSSMSRYIKVTAIVREFSSWWGELMFYFHLTFLEYNLVLGSSEMIWTGMALIFKISHDILKISSLSAENIIWVATRNKISEKRWLC